MVEEHGKEKADKLMKYQGLTTLSQEQALGFFELVWPEAPYKDRLKAAIICHQYGLNPLLKHIALLRFKKYDKQRNVVGESWSVVQEIASTRIIAHRKHNYPYLALSPRRMTDDEQIKINGEVDKSQIWAITQLRDLATGAEFSGTGSWPLDENVYGSEKGNTKLNMAKIRSERNALDRAFPAELPQGVEVVAENVIEGDFTLVTEATTDKTVKPGAGGKAVPGGESAAEQWDKMDKGGGAGKGADIPPAKGKTPEPAIAPPARPGVADLPLNPVFKNWGDLAAAAHKLGVTPGDVFRRANAKSWQDFPDYRDAWNYVEEIVTERNTPVS